jgi:hypothetical protein
MVSVMSCCDWLSSCNLLLSANVVTCLFAAAAETQDVEESTSCVVVTLVMLAQGTVSMPDDVISDTNTFKRAMKQVRTRHLLHLGFFSTEVKNSTVSMPHDVISDVSTGP